MRPERAERGERGREGPEERREERDKREERGGSEPEMGERGARKEGGQRGEGKEGRAGRDWERAEGREHKAKLKRSMTSQSGTEVRTEEGEDAWPNTKPTDNKAGTRQNQPRSTQRRCPKGEKWPKVTRRTKQERRTTGP